MKLKRTSQISNIRDAGYRDGVEAMRARALQLIQNWMTNSNASENEVAMKVLNALAGDIQIAQVSPDA